MKAFESTGFWNLPESPGDLVPGVLKRSSLGQMRLSLMGSLGGHELSMEPSQFGIIHGVVDSSPFGKFFTLIDCILTRHSLAMPGFSTQELLVKRAYAGYRLLDEPNPRFSEFGLRLDHLPDWVEKTGLSFRSKHVSYEIPDLIQLADQDGRVVLDFEYRLSGKGRRSSTIEEVIWVTVSNLRDTNVEEIQERYETPIQNFLTLATDIPNAIEEAVLTRPATDPDVPLKNESFHLLYEPVYRPKKETQTRHAHEMLFRLEDLGESMMDVFKQWLSFSEKFRPFCQLYFGLQYSPAPYLDSRFLNTLWATAMFSQCAALPETVAARSILERMTDELTQALPSEPARWMASALPWEHELALPWSLLSLIREHIEVMGPLIRDDAEGFVRRVMSAKRYWTTKEPPAEPEVTRSADLHWMVEKLMVLLKAAILSRIGLRKDQMLTFFSRNRKYTHLKTV